MSRASAPTRFFAAALSALKNETGIQLHVGGREIKREGDRKSTESSVTKNSLSNRRQGRTIISSIPSAKYGCKHECYPKRERESKMLKKKEKIKYKNV